MQPQLAILPAESIHIGKRQRTDDAATEKHIDELSKEIASNGLIHAIAINKEHELVAGYCRLSAVKKLDKEYMYASSSIGKGFIPCVIVHQDTERDQFRLELMENLRRKNLSPMDEAKAVAALHQMFAEEHGPDWTQGKTGEELDTLRGELRTSNAGHIEVGEALLIAQFSDDPDVAKAGTKREAVALAKKKMEQAFTQGLGALAPKPSMSDFVFQEGNLLDILPKWKDASFNGIVCDPPYGIGADEFGEQAMSRRHEYADTEVNAFSIAHVVFKEGYRICQDTAHLYMFCDLRMFSRFYTEATSCGWQVFNKPLIWHKINVGHAPWPGYFSNRYECILFAQKGDRKLSKSRSDVFEFAVPSERLHAAGKPVGLYEELLSLSFFPGELVLDPCAGGGTIFKAAKASGLRAVGIEMDPLYANICRQVIHEL